MKKILVFLFLLGSIQSFAQNSNLKLYAGFGGQDWDKVKDLTTDSNGNLYLIGTFNGTVDFDPGSGVTNRTSNGYTDIFVLKLNPQGNLEWVKTFGGTSSDDVARVQVINNQLVIGGGFQGLNVDFNPGTGTQYHSSNGSQDAFILKLTLDSGNYVWSSTFGGTSMDFVTDFAATASNDLIIGGQFQGTVDFDPGTGTTNLSSVGNYDLFIARYNASGSFLGASAMGGSDEDELVSLKVNTNNEIIIAGTFRGTADFDPGTSTQNLISNGYMADAYVAKYTSSGSYTWAKSFGGFDGERLQDMCIDNNDNIFTTGDFFMQVDFDPGTGVYTLTSHNSNDIFVQKLNTQGNFVWARSFGGNNPDLSYGIAADNDGNVYTYGAFSSDTVDLNPNASTSYFVNRNTYSYDSDDIFIQKLDEMGNFKFGKTLGGTFFDTPERIYIDDSANIYVCGYYESDSVYFDGLNQHYIVTNGGTDGFYAKYSQNTPMFTPSQNQLNSPPFNVSFTNHISDTTHLRWFWNFGDGVFSNLREPQHQYAYNGMYEASLMVIDTITGSTDTSSQIIECTGGTNNPCNFTASLKQSGAAIICATDSFKLSVDGVAGQSYSWFFNGVSIPNKNDSVLWAQAQGFYMAVVSESGCSKTSDYFVLANYPFTTPPITSWGNIQPCSNDSILMFTAPHYASYLWNNGATTDSIYVSTSGRYVVEVVDNYGCTLRSDEMVKNASAADIPEICMVATDPSTKKPLVKWNEPNDPSISSYNVYRESTIAGQYQLLGNVAYNTTASYLDQNAYPATKQYRYRISTVDTCGTETPTSNAHTTLHLMVNKSVNNSWVLIWRKYEGIAIQSYKIYSGTDSLNLTLLATISGNAESYLDQNPPSGNVYYQIEAVQNAACTGAIKSNAFNTKNAGGVGFQHVRDPFAELKLYPNPNVGTFMIENIQSSQVKVQISDLQGRVIYQQHFSHQNQVSIQQNMPAGMYLVCITDNQSNRKVLRFVVR